MSAAFDEAAAGYDTVAESALGQMVRSRVRAVLAPHVGAGTRVLDLGCGTGLDAKWAADRGARVVAVDASAAMAEMARHRLGIAAEVLVRDLNLPNWAEDLGAHDVVLANFGLVSCITDLAAFGASLQRIVVPNGPVVLVPMGRIVPWEQVPALLRLDLTTARRRFRRQAHAAVDYGDVPVRYFSARSLVAGLGPPWRLRRSEALGWALPTFDRRNVVDNHPGLGRLLERVDRAGGPLAARCSLGDHQIIVVEHR